MSESKLHWSIEPTYDMTFIKFFCECVKQLRIILSLERSIDFIQILNNFVIAKLGPTSAFHESRH